MLNALEKLIRSQHLITPGCKVLCAVSGGADSICLLHALYHLRPRLEFSLAAAHYDHQLRGQESAADAVFVRQFVEHCCGPQRLPDGSVLPPVQLYVGTGNVAAAARRRSTGIEETAREMRYQFLRETAAAAGCDRIATAHNSDDNVETVIFHLARGSGLRGLTGIQTASGQLIRPLLTTSRREIEEYLAYYGLPWREDHTNRDDAYARNRIRHKVVPILEDLFSNLPTRMANTTALLRTDEDCLVGLAAALADQAHMEEGELYISAQLIADSHDAIATRAVRQLIGTMNGGDQDCAAVHLNKVVALCRSQRKPSGRLDLPYGLTARREYGALVLSDKPVPGIITPVDASMPGVTDVGEWQMECVRDTYRGQFQEPLDFWLSCQAAPGITLRSRREGDKLQLLGRPSKTVKKWMIDLKIPRHVRDGLPVLVCGGGTVAAVVQLGPDKNCSPLPGQSAWHITFTQR